MESFLKIILLLFRKVINLVLIHHIDGLVQNCGDLFPNALELPQSCV